jgi:hypothetical protein
MAQSWTRLLNRRESPATPYGELVGKGCYPSQGHCVGPDLTPHCDAGSHSATQYGERVGQGLCPTRVTAQSRTRLPTRRESPATPYGELVGKGCYPSRGLGAEPDPTPESQGVHPQRHMVSGWGKGATLPWVMVWGRALLPTASQGVNPQPRMVSEWGKGVALPESRYSARPDSRIAGRATLCVPSSCRSRGGQA